PPARRSRMNAHRSGRYRARGALATTPLLPEPSPTPAPTLPGRGQGFSLPSRQGASRRREGTPELTTQGTRWVGAARSARAWSWARTVPVGDNGVIPRARRDQGRLAAEATVPFEVP